MIGIMVLYLSHSLNLEILQNNFNVLDSKVPPPPPLPPPPPPLRVGFQALKWKINTDFQFWERLN